MRRRCASSRRCARAGASGANRPRCSSVGAPDDAPYWGPSTSPAAKLVRVVRERCRTDDVLVAVETLGMVRPEVPTLLIWDNAPPHHPHRVRDAAHETGIALAVLPFRSPELMPLADLWRGLQATIAANRCSPALADQVERRDLAGWHEHPGPPPPLRRAFVSIRVATYLSGTTAYTPSTGSRIPGMLWSPLGFAARYAGWLQSVSSLLESPATAICCPSFGAHRPPTKRRHQRLDCIVKGGGKSDRATVTPRWPVGCGRCRRRAPRPLRRPLRSRAG